MGLVSLITNALFGGKDVEVKNDAAEGSVDDSQPEDGCLPNTFAMDDNDRLFWITRTEDGDCARVEVEDSDVDYRNRRPDKRRNNTPLTEEGIEKLERHYQIVEVARHDSRESIRIAAVNHIRVGNILKDIAENDPSEDVKNAALARREQLGDGMTVEKGSFVVHHGFSDDLKYVHDINEDQLLVVELDDYQNGNERYGSEKATIADVTPVPIKAIQNSYGEGKLKIINDDELQYTTELKSGRGLRLVIEDASRWSLELMLTKNSVGSFYLEFRPEKKMPKEAQSFDEWDEMGNNTDFFFADGLFVNGDREALQKTKAIIEQIDPKFATSLPPFMGKNKFYALVLGDPVTLQISGNIAIPDHVLQSMSGVGNLSKMATIKLRSVELMDMIKNQPHLLDESVKLLERYADVIETLEGEYSRVTNPETVGELLVKTMITCRFCDGQVRVAADKVCPNCGGRNS